MAIEQLLAGISPAEFVANYLHKLPLAMRGSAEGYIPLGSWATIADLLAQPEADLLFARGGKPYEGPRPQSLAAAKELHSDGHTLLVRHAERHQPAIAELGQSFYEDFYAPIDIHVYCTPGTQHGFGWHYDAEDVFILQTEGVKQYLLRKNTVHPWPTDESMPENLAFEREIMPVMKCTLAPGDWLYIPAGYWHMATAAVDSISLSVGLLFPTALDVLHLLRPRLLDSLLWRQRLPVGGKLAALLQTDTDQDYTQLLSSLAEDLQKQLCDELFRARLIASRTQDHKG